MCGIAGCVSRDVTSAQLVHKMCDALRHRGPDGTGFHIEDDCALGVARLSIIDPEGGAQPMTNEDGSVWVAFNGEIYNYRQLREELTRQGHRFQTTCDTEVLVHLYEEYGSAGIPRLRACLPSTYGIRLPSEFCWQETASERSRFIMRRSRGGFSLRANWTPSCVLGFPVISTARHCSCTSSSSTCRNRSQAYARYANWLQAVG